MDPGVTCYKENTERPATDWCPVCERMDSPFRMILPSLSCEKVHGLMWPDPAKQRDGAFIMFYLVGFCVSPQAWSMHMCDVLKEIEQERERCENKTSGNTTTGHSP